MSSIVILNGFDRSGSSMIARVLTKHPRIELIFQPFNSTNVRRRMYEVWDDHTAEPEDVAFLEGLAKGELREDYIVSHWHAKYSTVNEIVPSQLHVVKTTLNHLTAAWMGKQFPDVPMWGIWRDPYAILSSILRNGFFSEWYGDDAVGQVQETVQRHPSEFSPYEGIRPDSTSDIQKTAYLIATRSYFFFRHIPRNRIVRYEGVVANPNRELGRMTRAFGLDEFDFSPFIHTDYNVVGESLGPGTGRDVVGERDRPFVDRLFSPLVNGD